ncbi:MAG: hypothetical protein WKF37_16115, partial [Bryobacteraceae bacterium]
SFSLFAIAAFAGEFKGTISDSKCGAAHADASEKSMKCSQACVKGGKAPVLVVGDKVYKIADSSLAKVTDHVGHKVVVTGSAEGDTLTIENVTME